MSRSVRVRPATDGSSPRAHQLRTVPRPTPAIVAASATVSSAGCLTSLECDGHRLRGSSIGACLQRAGLGRTEAVGTGPWTVPLRRG